MIKLFIFLILIGPICSCKKTDNPVEPQGPSPLTLISTHDLNLPEPSGLCSFLDENLITVSDADGKIRILSLEGQITETIDIQGVDLEGITFDNSDSTIYAIDESKGNLTAYSVSGSKLNEWQITGGGNNGLEGCTIDSENSIVYMVKQRSPGQLYSFNLVNESLVTIEIDFSEDFSGIFYDKQENLLWILSDQSQTIYVCDTSGGVVRTHSYDIDQAEGIVINNESNVIYIVSDSKEKLYVLDKP